MSHRKATPPCCDEDNLSLYMSDHADSHRTPLPPYYIKKERHDGQQDQIKRDVEVFFLYV